MGIYIDMEMPTSCPCELLGIGYDLYCSFAGGIPARVKEYYECCQNGTRPSWCPLVYVPAHGRLIDARELRQACYQHYEDFMNGKIDGETAILNIEKEIIVAPTIIPAGEGE